jgi:hypothetical protein
MSISIQIRELYKIEAHPILSTALQQSTLPSRSSHINKSDVVGIALNALPIPNDSTPWEQVIEYRSDPDSQARFLDLRNWMSEVARGQLSLFEVEEKLEYLISQYQRHMKLHRMKTTAGSFETIIVSTAEVLEDLVKFKWSKIAKMLFSFRQRQIALLEGELYSPGNEVAYIVHTKEAFPEK